MPYKVVIFINQFKQGWTETWYTNTTMTVTSFGTPLWKNFFNSRLNFLSDGCTIYGARWTNLGAARQTFSQTFGATYVSPETTVEDVIPVDAVVKILANNGQYKHMYFRGLDQPDSQLDNKGNPILTPSLISAINKYMTAAAALGLCIQTEQTVTTNPGLLTTPCTLIEPNVGNPNWTDVLTLVAPTFPGFAPWYVRFNRVPKDNVPGFPRETQVQVFTPTTPGKITIAYRYRASTPTVSPSNMTATQLLYNYPAVVAPSTGNPYWFFVSFNERKTGRAFGVPRGRARAVVKAQ